MAIGTTCCSMPHGYNLVVINNQVTKKSEIHEILEGLDKSVDPCFLQTGGLNFNTMVLNSDSGEVTSLAAYFNKYLVSVEQLNSILGGVSRQGGASLQVGVLFYALAIFGFKSCIHRLADKFPPLVRSGTCPGGTCPF